MPLGQRPQRGADGVAAESPGVPGHPFVMKVINGVHSLGTGQRVFGVGQPPGVGRVLELVGKGIGDDYSASGTPSELTPLAKIIRSGVAFLQFTANH